MVSAWPGHSILTTRESFFNKCPSCRELINGSEITDVNLAPLLLTVLALGVIIRVVSLRRVGQYLMGLILTPILMGVAWYFARDIWLGATFGQKAMMVVAIPIVLFAGFLAILPSRVREQLLAFFLYDLFSAIGRIGRRMVVGIFSMFWDRRR